MAEIQASQARTQTREEELSNRQQFPICHPSTFGRQFDRWLLGLAEATTQGGAAAAKAFFGCAGGSVALPGVVPALDLKQTAAVFLIGAAYHFFDYLASNPLSAVQTKN